MTLRQIELNEGVLPGVQAFLVALLGGNGALGVLSALTNLLMAIAFLRQARAGRKRAMTLSLALLGAGVLNLSRLVATGQVSDLYAGYYAWLAPSASPVRRCSCTHASCRWRAEESRGSRTVAVPSVPQAGATARW